MNRPSANPNGRAFSRTYSNTFRSTAGVREFNSRVFCFDERGRPVLWAQVAREVAEASRRFWNSPKREGKMPNNYASF